MTHQPDTWKGFEMQGPYCELLREVNREVISDLGLRCTSRVPAESGAVPLVWAGWKQNHESSAQPGDAARVLFEMIQQQGLELINTFMDWSPTHSPLAEADYWQIAESSEKMKIWKVLDRVAIPQDWTGRSVFLRDRPAQKRTVRWPDLTILRMKKGNQENGAWTPGREGQSTLKNDEAFTTAMETNMEMQMCATGEIELEDLGKLISSTVPHERNGMSRQIHKSREHSEAEIRVNL